ncbi:MAG: hypothetical protein RL042_850 [Nitrospirota bacterium]
MRMMLNTILSKTVKMIEIENGRKLVPKAGFEPAHPCGR